LITAHWGISLHAWLWPPRPRSSVLRPHAGDVDAHCCRQSRSASGFCPTST